MVTLNRVWPLKGRYVVTGIDTQGKRFSLRFQNVLRAMSVNVHKGSLWSENSDGKRTLIRRVFN